jgi:hypothetical protein
MVKVMARNIEENINRTRDRIVLTALSTDGSEKIDGSLQKKPLRCINCGGDHYINNCPEFLELRSTKEERQANLTSDATTFVTYQINAIGVKGFKQMEVLLDSQANLSIMRPKLLKASEKDESKVQLNGVGSIQSLSDIMRSYMNHSIVLKCTYQTET